MSDPDEKTRLIRRSSAGETGPESAPPRNIPIRSFDPEATIYGDEGQPEKTRIIRREEKYPTQDERTVLVRPSRDEGMGQEAEDGPVVGWVVVVEGPGRGKSVPLGYGMNTIGRDPGNRVALPFGDSRISRLKHAVLAYDPRGRKFFIQHGESTNLTYVGDAPVLSPVELKHGELIRLGASTVLKFIPLCGDDFQWE